MAIYLIQYYLKVTVKKNCHALVRIDGGEPEFLSISEDLESETMTFSEDQYCKVAGTIQFNVAKALIRKYIKKLLCRDDVKVAFITIPDWYESKWTQETIRVEDPDQPTYRRNPETNELEVLGDAGEYEKYYN